MLCWAINEVIIYFYVEIILRSQKTVVRRLKTEVRRPKSGGKKWSGWEMGFLPSVEMTGIFKFKFKSKFKFMVLVN